jgi:hypothetical protein
VAGHLVLPEGAYVSAAGGQFLTGAEVARSIERGQDVDIDVISPDDVEFPDLSDALGGDAVRQALGTLPNSTIQIPVANRAAQAVQARLEALLDSGGIERRRTVNGRWLAFRLDDLPAAQTFLSGAYAEQAEALLLATAWEPNGDQVISRVRVGDSVLLQCLVAALVGAGGRYEVKWTPKYAPVECRIRSGHAVRFGAFVEVDPVLRTTTATYELDLAGSGRPIVALAVTTSML